MRRRTFLKIVSYSAFAAALDCMGAEDSLEYLARLPVNTRCIGQLIEDPTGELYRKRLAESLPVKFEIAHRCLAESYESYAHMDLANKVKTIGSFIRENKIALDAAVKEHTKGVEPGRLSVVCRGMFGEGSLSDVYARSCPGILDMAYAAGMASDLAYGIDTGVDRLGYMDNLMVHPGTFGFMLFSRAHLSSLGQTHSLEEKELVLGEINRFYGKAEIGANSSLDRRLLAWCVSETQRRAPQSLLYPFVNDTLSRASELARDRRDYNSPQQI